MGRAMAAWVRVSSSGLGPGWRKGWRCSKTLRVLGEIFILASWSGMGVVGSVREMRVLAGRRVARLTAAGTMVERVVPMGEQ